MKSKTCKLLRNIFMGVGVIGGLIIWKFVPDMIKNTPTFHAGNGDYGSKTGMLLVLILPLFALCFRPEIPDFHGEDIDLIAEESENCKKKAYSAGMVLALGMSLLTIILMLCGLLFF